jgi:hypothetical protein
MQPSGFFWFTVMLYRSYAKYVWTHIFDALLSHSLFLSCIFSSSENDLSFYGFCRRYFYLISWGDLCILRCCGFKMCPCFVDNHASDHCMWHKNGTMYVVLFFFKIGKPQPHVRSTVFWHTKLLNEDNLCRYSFMLYKLRRSMYVGTVFCSIHSFISLTPLFLCGKW